MNDSVNEPKEKKLKSSEPDLKITVGNEEEGTIVVHHCHSTIMANHSRYIDAMLASNMIESQTSEVSFPDISPPIWDKMMGLLEDPSQIRQVTLQDAMLVAPHYNKYDFPRGRQLCTQVLVDFIQKKQETSDLDLLVEIALLADSANLTEVKEASLKDLRRRFEWFETRIMFTEEHVKKLVPLIANDTKLLRIVQNGDREKVLNPLFPELLVQRYSSWQARRFLNIAVHQIELSGSECNADGIFDSKWSWVCQRKGRWAGQEIGFSIEIDENWEIIGQTLPEIDEDGERDYENVVRKVLWRCPYSGNMSLPPQTGWKAVDELARGDPKVKYIYRGEA